VSGLKTAQAVKEYLRLNIWQSKAPEKTELCWKSQQEHKDEKLSAPGDWHAESIPKYKAQVDLMQPAMAGQQTHMIGTKAWNAQYGKLLGGGGGSGNAGFHDSLVGPALMVRSEVLFIHLTPTSSSAPSRTWRTAK